MTTLCIEPATLDDTPMVARIQVDAWRAAYRGIVPAAFLAGMRVDEREAAWRRTVAAGNPTLWVAKEDALVRGWALFGACRDEGALASQAELWALYVAPARWYTGVGRRLWQGVRDELRRRGYTHCSVRALEQNLPALRFYRSVGFVPDGLPPRHLELGGERLPEVRLIQAL
jgi:GNAT superfamily N-acetyltransferase